MDLRKQAANLLTACRIFGSLGLLALPADVRAMIGGAASALRLDGSKEELDG